MFIVIYLQLLMLCVQVFLHPAQKNEEEDDDILPYPNKIIRNKTIEEQNEEATKEYWNNEATKVLKRKLSANLNKNVAKNVIFFLGDGMSIPTIAATRMYLGGEEEQLSFEKFPYTGLSKTYCVDHQTADSACSATAYLGGVKANLATIGVSAAVNKRNCSAMNRKENQVDSIARLFQLKGRRTGLVTTTRVTHASPAGVYAHTAYRRWESDTSVMKSEHDPKECRDIAYQLVFGETGKNLQVILGGGRKNFLPTEETDEDNQPGARSDHANLINEWIKQKRSLGAKYEYVSDRQQLRRVRNDTEYLLGLFDNGHMRFNLERDPERQPSLEEMTEAAIRTLQKGPEGFFLFVEGGRIDSAHHLSSPHKALDETAEFSKAVQKAVDMTDERDTLIVVTADHAHTMSYAGYAQRGSQIFGYGGKAMDDDLYPILNYANGPGYRVMDGGLRFVPSENQMSEVGFQWPSTTPLASETHGADDVGIFARGPWAHLFSGVMEENVTPHLVAFAACVSNEVPCDNFRKEA
ncbi:unnamed protein product [Phyllotreta striolata]|uniref:alkaline phosphatase n=1 Tax=Phyllotreta striolata TaxID=444603 RepID=A0A9N9XMI0_PHYSR|nr:unnamed protein product [Phyllotreta striolata]